MFYQNQNFLIYMISSEMAFWLLCELMYLMAGGGVGSSDRGSFQFQTEEGKGQLWIRLGSSECFPMERKNISFESFISQTSDI